jgi:hypothetical protein
MPKIAIDKDIALWPVGTRGTGKLRNNAYPWREMKIGDSFYVPDILYLSMKSTVVYQEKMTGRVYRLRTFDTGVRVWRVA